MRRRVLAAIAAVVPASLVACFSAPAERPRPVEVPIGEYKVDDAQLGAAARVAAPDAGAPVTAPVDAVAVKLDTRNGFAGGTLGQAPRAYRGLRSTQKTAERQVFRAPGVTYAGAPLNGIDFTFVKGKLAIVAFAVKVNTDCKAVRQALEKDFGPPQKSAASPELAVWKGAKVGLRYEGGATCGGTVASREHAPAEFDALDP